MNLQVLIIALLVLSAQKAYGRAIDDVDNSIESNSDSQQQPQQQQQQTQSKSQSRKQTKSRALFDEDWIKLTKTPPAKVMQQFGQPVEILCEVMGSQVPSIQWIVGNLPLSEIDSLDSNTISETSPSAIVRVRSIHVVDHMLSEPRTYTCIGRTGSKIVYASTTVYPQADLKDLIQLQDKPLMKQQKPRIIYNEKLHLDLVGSNILLPCKVHAPRTRAEIFWMNGDGKIIEQSQRFKLLPTGDLLITDIKWEDMGAYKCIARNAYGKDTADTFIYPVLKEEN